MFPFLRLPPQLLIEAVIRDPVAAAFEIAESQVALPYLRQFLLGPGSSSLLVK